MPDLLLFSALVLAWWLLRRTPRKAGWVDLPAYYKTPHWIATRNRKRRAGRYKCEKCGSKTRLEVHHVHYRTLYKERMSDLQLLCDKCHTRGSGRK